MSPPDLHDFARRYTAAWCSQDPSRVAACYSPDGSLRVNDDPPAVGRAEITQVAQGFMTTFPDLQVLCDDLVISNGRTEFHWTLIGTHDGHSVRVSGFEVWKLSAEGLIAESLGSFDAAEYERQMFGNFKSSDTSSLE